MEAYKMKYSLGLDIGSESIGWAVVQLDENNNPVKLVNFGVRAFEAVQRESDASSTPAKERRIARSQRRRLRNKKRRKRKLIDLCVELGIFSNRQQAISALENGKKGESPWKLRVKALDQKLSPEDWFRVLYHMVNHRGFDVRIKGSDEEKGKLKEAASKIRNAWKRKGYRTVAEYFEKDQEWKALHGERRRNKEGDYTFTIHRDDIIEEVQTLFARQRELGNKFADEEFENRFLQILDEKPQIAEGDEIKKLVGECVFEKGELRAPKATLTSQLYVAYQTLSNVSVVDAETGEERKLSPKEIEELISLGFEKKDIKPSHILKVCGINDGFVTGLSDSEKVFSFVYFHKIKETLKEIYKELETDLKNPDFFDKVAEILTYFKRYESVREKLLELGLPIEAAERLSSLDFKGHHKLSLKAMKRLIPYLRKGMTYPEAIRKAGYQEALVDAIKVINKIPPFDSAESHPEVRRRFLSITNPNVIRALVQTRKVFNAIVERYGLPEKVVIELARDFAITKDRKKRLQAEQKQREKERKKYAEIIANELKKIGVGFEEPSSKMIEKFILYELQEGKSAYSLKPIDLERLLLDENYAEIDHIIPRSISFNNGMENKVLVLTDDNRNKGDELAAVFVKRYFGEEHFNRYKNEFVEGILLKKMKELPHRNRELKKKIEYLLKEEISEEEKIKLQTRYLVATGFITKFFKAVLEAYYKGKIKLIPVRGGLIAQLRKLAGLNELKKRGESDKHHAVDAALCAVIDHKIIKKMSDYYKSIDFKRRFGKPHPDFMDGFEPFEGFRKEVLNMFDSIIVSRSPRKRATGRGHKDTIYSIDELRKSSFMLPENGRISIPKGMPLPKKRVRLDQLTCAEIEDILREPSPILVDERSNWKLYSLIRRRLKETENDGKANPKKWAIIAFGSEDGKIYLPRKDGSRGHEVKKITIYTNIRSGVIVRRGIAENANLVRLDFYSKNDKKGRKRYYAVPVYTADIALGVTPKKAVVAHKDESEWLEVDDSFDFLFHLFPGEYLEVQKNEEDETQLVFFKSFDRSGAKIVVDLHDRSEKDIRIAYTNCFSIRKVYVDLLGNCYPIKSEKKIY
ncbi:MAG: type II CRISPR RNA-guided endonuclease Cas9 [Archaeoglobaceae archaeon]